MLTAAKSAWAAGQDSVAASEAMNYLIQIDPESSAYSAAEGLIKEISSSIKSDREFELRQKHNDEVTLQKALIEGSRDVGVAYGKGQQPITTHVNWIRR